MTWNTSGMMTGGIIADPGELFRGALDLIDRSFSKINESKKKSEVPLKKTYLEFKEILSKNVKDKTVALYNSSFDFLFEILGEDYDLKNLDRNKAISIRKSVMNKNVRKDTDETLANKTVNRYINNYSSLMNYLIEELQVLDIKNPFDGLRLSEAKKLGKTNRRSYTTDEVNKILSYEITSKREAKTIRNSAYWFPKIAFYSAMRLNEIAELTVNDFHKSNGVDFIQLFDKDLKNENSERRIPIHSKLIEYGFLDFVEEQKKRNIQYLFQDLRNRKKTKTIERDGWGITVSKWFNGVMSNKLEIEKLSETSQKLDFHGIRTTVLKFFKREGLNAYIVKQIAGHGDDDVTFDDYGHETNTKITQLKEVIESIRYD